MARLKEIIKDLEYESIHNFQDAEIGFVCCDSKKAESNCLFVAVKGNAADGHNFIIEAIKKGAVCIICQDDFTAKENVTKIIVRDSRIALAKVAASFFGYPSKKITMIGITGTNGKTTTLYLIEKILSFCGFSVGTIGTISYKFKNRTIPAVNTTPGPLELQWFLKQMADDGIQYAVMEVSSHSLDQQRVFGIDFKTAIFTNLTQDHLDYHKTLEDYFAVKLLLFKNLNPQSYAVINIDDPYGKRIIKSTGAKIITYAINENADIKAENLILGLKGAQFFIKTKNGRLQIKTDLIGRHNVYNILAAVGAAVAGGLDLEVIKDAIKNFKAPAGRLQPVERGQAFGVFVDYAHTEDALKNVLSTLRELTNKNIILVFGCGGDRDRLKRPKMGNVASKLADCVIITSDNPRSENPEDIIKEIEKGIDGNFKNYNIEIDRRAAIERALKTATKEDIVLIAGKGHETYQIFKEKTVPFDDVKITEGILKLCLP